MCMHVFCAAHTWTQMFFCCAGNKDSGAAFKALHWLHPKAAPCSLFSLQYFILRFSWESNDVVVVPLGRRWWFCRTIWSTSARLGMMWYVLTLIRGSVHTVTHARMLRGLKFERSAVSKRAGAHFDKLASTKTSFQPPCRAKNKTSWLSQSQICCPPARQSASSCFMHLQIINGVVRRMWLPVARELRPDLCVFIQVRRR